MEIKEELLANGPMVTQMVVYEDLLTYANGIYQHREGSIIGGHAVLLTGWGKTHHDEEFWEVQNSWGPDWGENKGFFRIKAGDSEIATELFGGALSCEAQSKEGGNYSKLFMQ
jgi:cathepsin B